MAGFERFKKRESALEDGWAFVDTLCVWQMSGYLPIVRRSDVFEHPKSLE